MADVNPQAEFLLRRNRELGILNQIAQALNREVDLDRALAQPQGTPQWLPERMWETRVGEIPLSIPKLREGTFSPSLLESRKRSEKALLAVVQTAYVKGVSTRKVDDLL